MCLEKRCYLQEETWLGRRLKAEDRDSLEKISEAGVGGVNKLNKWAS